MQIKTETKDLQKNKVVLQVGLDQAIYEKVAIFATNSGLDMSSTLRFMINSVVNGTLKYQNGHHFLNNEPTK